MALGRTAVLKLMIIAAASAVAYYYFIYLPDRDARIEARSQLEKRLVEERAREEARRQALEKDAANTRYRECLSVAYRNYSAEWDQACKIRSTILAEQLAKCASGKDICQNLYGEKVPHKECTLPKEANAPLNARHEKNRDRCLEEFRAGIQ